jgi:hypothetical protein
MAKPAQRSARSARAPVKSKANPASDTFTIQAGSCSEILPVG